MTTFPKNFSVTELPKTFSVSDFIENNTWDPTFTESPRELKDPNAVHNIFGPNTLVSLGRGDSSQDLQGEARVYSQSQQHSHVPHPSYGHTQQSLHQKMDDGRHKMVKAPIPSFNSMDQYQHPRTPQHHDLTDRHGIITTEVKTENHDNGLDDDDKEYGPDEELTPEELANKHKKERRMLSNRESARRSRQRKQHHLDDLQTKVSQLRADNGKLMERLSMVNHHYSNILEENRKLSNERERLNMQLDHQGISAVKKESR